MSGRTFCIVKCTGANFSTGKIENGKAGKFSVITSITCVFFEKGNIFDLCTYRLNYDIRVYMSNNRNLEKFNYINKKKHNVFNGYYIDDRPTSHDSNYVKEFIKEKIKSFNCEVYAKGIQLENLFFNKEIIINDLTNLGCPKYDYIKDKVTILNEMKTKISSEMLYKLQNELLNDVLLNSDVEQHISLNECLVFAYYLRKLNLS